MLNASLTFPLESHAVLRVTADRQRLPLNLQYDSFENPNRTWFLRSTQPIASPQLTKAGQDEISHVWSTTSEDHFARQLIENQTRPHILHGLEPVRRSTETTISLADIGSVTSVPANAAWLEESLNELAACPADAIDEGLEKPSELGLTKAKRLLQEVSNHVIERPDIYPMDEGAIVIDF